MELKIVFNKDDITLRHATIADAKLLCQWWNDGPIMAHASFPNGVNTTEETVISLISKETDNTIRRWIIEIGGEPSGEMNYRNMGDNIAEIGIKICDFTKQDKGYGSKILTLFIGYLFNSLKYTKIVLDTKPDNKRAQHFYEKLGFVKTKENGDAIYYELEQIK